MAEIETERLCLRRFTADDAVFFLALANDPDWIASIGQRNIHDVAAARAYLEKVYLPPYTRDGFGFYLVERRDSAQAIGMCGVFKREGLDDADIGFAFLPSHRGVGYAEEAARASLVYADNVLGLKRVVAVVAPGNVASIKLLTKIGLVYERNVRLHETAAPLLLYGIDIKRAR